MSKTVDPISGNAEGRSESPGRLMASIVPGTDVFDRLAYLLGNLTERLPRWSSQFIQLMDDFDELWDIDDPLLSDEPVISL